ncbi:MAG: helix-turn-helix domain-containing protein [Chloroflexota bacterium]|nr:helix-turn-helix domain-containing protein [Chloroflexota bacterium]
MQATAPPPPFLNRGPGYSVSVADIVRLALPSGSAVLSGQGGLQRSIFWARLLGARQASPGSIGAGEMVILPAATVQARAFGRWVRELADAGVEAFLVAADPVPDGLAVAAELDLPVIRLPAHASLPEAERAIISLIVDREAQLRRKVEQIYERLLTTLVGDEGISALAEEVANVTGRPTIVLDEYFRIQVTQPDDDETLALGHALGRALAAEDPRAAGGRGVGPLRLAPTGGAPEALVVPLRLRGTPAGYLILGGDAAVSDLDRQVAERAARVLGIELAKQRAVTEAQLRLQGDFLDDLLSGGYPSDEAMIARGRWMGHDLTRPHLVLTLHLDPRDGPDRESSRLQAADLVRTELARLAPGAIVREQQGTLALAVPRVAAPDRAESLELAERIRHRLAALLPDCRVSVGVGRYHAEVRGLARAYREADQALAIGRALLGGDRSVHFEDLGVQRLLFQLRDNPELAAFYEDLLGKLQAHDERNGSELVNTLEAFFECHGNHVRTAQRLHLHRNTLLYRLERARQVLSFELDDAETRLALQVALKIGRVIGRRPLDAPSGG